jgi:hypothetical protein
MLCDKYKEALVEAAASDAALPNALREHLEACEHCAAMLAGERTLFAAVDAGLHRAANAKVGCSFIANVKASLATETVPARNPIPGWALVCATGALALFAAFLSLPRGAHNKTHTEAITSPSMVRDLHIQAQNERVPRIGRKSENVETFYGGYSAYAPSDAGGCPRLEKHRAFEKP